MLLHVGWVPHRVHAITLRCSQPSSSSSTARSSSSSGAAATLACTRAGWRGCRFGPRALALEFKIPAGSACDQVVEVSIPLVPRIAASRRFALCFSFFSYIREQLAHAAMVNFPKELKSYCRHEKCKTHKDWRVSQYKVCSQ